MILIISFILNNMNEYILMTLKSNDDYQEEELSKDDLLYFKHKRIKYNIIYILLCGYPYDIKMKLPINELRKRNIHLDNIIRDNVIQEEIYTRINYYKRNNSIIIYLNKIIVFLITTAKLAGGILQQPDDSQLGGYTPYFY